MNIYSDLLGLQSVCDDIAASVIGCSNTDTLIVCKIPFFRVGIEFLKYLVFIRYAKFVGLKYALAVFFCYFIIEYEAVWIFTILCRPDCKEVRLSPALISCELSLKSYLDPLRSYLLLILTVDPDLLTGEYELADLRIVHANKICTVGILRSLITVDIYLAVFIYGECNGISHKISLGCLCLYKSIISGGQLCYLYLLGS